MYNFNGISKVEVFYFLWRKFRLLNTLSCIKYFIIYIFFFDLIYPLMHHHKIKYTCNNFLPLYFLSLIFLPFLCHFMPRLFHFLLLICKLCLVYAFLCLSLLFYTIILSFDFLNEEEKSHFFCLKIDIFWKNDFKKKQSICDAKYPNLKLNKNYFNGDKTFFSVKYKKICKNLPLLCLYRLFLMHK